MNGSYCRRHLVTDWKMPTQHLMEEAEASSDEIDDEEEQRTEEQNSILT